MMKKIAILIGGWHYPKEFYTQVSKLKYPTGHDVDTFVISHRDIDLPIVHEEKKKILDKINKETDLGKLDHELYEHPLTKEYVKSLGFDLIEAENLFGDYYFINQWLELYDYNDYDYICFLHDDTYIADYNLVTDIIENRCELFNRDNRKSEDSEWLMIFNTSAPNTTVPRGSFAFFKREFFDIVETFDFQSDDAYKIDYNRLGKVDSPDNMSTLGTWNNITRFLNNIVDRKGITDKIVKLSTGYRTSQYIVEAERGFMTKIFS